MKPFEYETPEDLDTAIDRLAAAGEDGHLIAGGTAMILLLKQGLIEPSVLISLARLTGLAHIRVDDGHVEIGAMVPLRRIEHDPAIRAHLPAVADAVSQVATVRIRNQATIGGNLAHADPAQDPPPILLVHDASVVVRGPGGERTIALADLFVDVFETSIEPDEILVKVLVPIPAPTTRSIYRKFLPRTVDDYATVGVAVRLELGPDRTIEAARIALGNAASIPMRATAGERALIGGQPSVDLFDVAAGLAAEAADPGDDIRGTAAYKRQMIRVWTRRALAEAADIAEARP